MDIRDVIINTSKVLRMSITSSQIDEVIKHLFYRIKPEDKNSLRFSGRYIRVCKKHPYSKLKIVYNKDKDEYKWLCSTCNSEMELLHTKDVKIEKRVCNKSLKIEQKKLLEKIDTGEIDFNSLSAGKKAHVSRLRRLLGKK